MHFDEIAEAFIVLAIGFGLFIYSSTISTLSDSQELVYTSADFAFLVIYEIIAFSIIVCILKWRRWTLGDFNLDFHPNMIAVAILLVLFRTVFGNAIYGIHGLLNPDSSALQQLPVTVQAGFINILSVTIVNSIYEEVLLTGYIFKRFEKFHPTIIVLISFVVRASYHTYQGWANIPMILVLSLIFGFYYLRYQKLWPLIIAHTLGNAISFYSLS